MKKQTLLWLSILGMLAGISLAVDALAGYVLAQPPGSQPTSPGCDNIAASENSLGPCHSPMKFCQYEDFSGCTSAQNWVFPSASEWPITFIQKAGYNCRGTLMPCYYEVVCRWENEGSPHCREDYATGIYFKPFLESIPCPPQ